MKMKTITLNSDNSHGNNKNNKNNKKSMRYDLISLKQFQTASNSFKQFQIVYKV